ncbi:hypothetical protein [Cytobacillus praedii]|uniref:hypothetical protein n=1 Tax=Cytobacillus praedii TaxID=1742358 RepID=UPI002E1A2E9A|nr:hypothetical protein [Cytobacillus praedii]
MKKKAIKIAASTAVAASAFVAAAPANKADAAVNVDQLVKDAENAAGALKWAISVEGTADGQTAPHALYNLTKDANKAAKAAVAKAKGNDKVLYTARLQAVELQISRAMAYIDGITAGKKIAADTATLNAAIAAKDLTKVEAAYHQMTKEYRKQAALLDRVYGQSTRDVIRNATKKPAEAAIEAVKVDVTVKMHLDAADKAIKAGDLKAAGESLEKAQAWIDKVSTTFKAELTKSSEDVANALPLAVTGLTRVDENTLIIKFSKAADVAPVSNFTFDNNLSVTSTSLSDDKKSVTLKTTTQEKGKTYTLSYKGEKTKLSFTTAPASGNSNITVDAKDVSRQDAATSRSYTVTVKDPTTNQPYNGYVTIKLKKAAADLTASATDANGKVSFVVTNDGTAENVVPVVLLDRNGNQTKDSNDLEHEAGATVYYAAGTDITTATAVDYVNKTDKYFAVATKKYVYDENDLYQLKVGGVYKNISLADFEAALSKSDSVLVNYAVTSTGAYNKNGVSVFKIDTNVSESILKVNNVPTRVVGNTYTLQGTGEPNSVILIKGTTVDYSAEVNSSGSWSYTVPLNVAAQNTFTIDQVVKGTENSATPTPTHAGASKTINIYQGDFNITAATSSGTAGTALVLDGTSATLTLDFTKFDDLNIADNASITVKDLDGTTATFTNTQKLTSFVASDADNTDGNGWKERLVITLGLPTSLQAGADSKLDGLVEITAISGVTTHKTNLLVNLKTGDVIAE